MLISAGEICNLLTMAEVFSTVGLVMDITAVFGLILLAHAEAGMPVRLVDDHH